MSRPLLNLGLLCRSKSQAATAEPRRRADVALRIGTLAADCYPTIADSPGKGLARGVRLARRARQLRQPPDLGPAPADLSLAPDDLGTSPDLDVEQPLVMRGGCSCSF
jgi:hypothetical protein